MTHAKDVPLEQRSDDELIALFARYRDAASIAERKLAVRSWHILIARAHERIRGWVAAFRFPGHPDVRVPASDIDDVVQQALERCLERLVESFRGGTAAEFRAALKTCVYFTCMDRCREAMRREMAIVGSLDETVPAGGDGDAQGRFDQALARDAARAEDDRSAAALALHAIIQAIDDVPNSDMRAVIRLTMQGYSSREIAEELEKTVANVDQLRSRGIRKLREILDRDD